MSEKDEKRVESRRKFMKTMALTGGGAAMVVSAASVGAAGPAEEIQETETARGYHETEHIRNYYDKAQF